MELSRFNEWSHHVTLRPDRADFEDTTRLVNPAGYPVGRRVWKVWNGRQ